MSPSKAGVVVYSDLELEEDTRLARSASGLLAAASVKSASFELREVSDFRGSDLGDCNGPKTKETQKQHKAKRMVKISRTYFHTDFSLFPVETQYV